MTLRSPFQRQQLLFLSAAAALLLFGRAAKAQDLVIVVDGRQVQGKVLGASPAGVQLQVQGGAVTLPMKSIKEVRMAAPPSEWLLAQKAYEAKAYDSALDALKKLEKYKGLPVDWAQQAAAMLGDVYIAKNDIPAAEAAYADFQKIYSGAQAGPQTELGLARLAFAKKDFDTAKSKVEPVTDAALKEKNVPNALAVAYSQAFLIRGQILEAQNDFSGALENYLRTVTLFYHDRTAVAQAQEKADALRKAHPEVFVP